MVVTLLYDVGSKSSRYRLTFVWSNWQNLTKKKKSYDDMCTDWEYMGHIRRYSIRLYHLFFLFLRDSIWLEKEKEEEANGTQFTKNVCNRRTPRDFQSKTHCGKLERRLVVRFFPSEFRFNVARRSVYTHTQCYDPLKENFWFFSWIVDNIKPVVEVIIL